MDNATRLEQLIAEWKPSGATELCFVQDMAAAREQLEHIRTARTADPLDLKLLRLEEAALRSFHRAIEGITKLRSAAARNRDGQAKPQARDVDAALAAMMSEPLSFPMPRIARPCPPMPVHLQREFDVHKRRDPDFDPIMDRTQMSKELQRWFEKHPA